MLLNKLSQATSVTRPNKRLQYRVGHVSLFAASRSTTTDKTGIGTRLCWWQSWPRVVLRQTFCTSSCLCCKNSFATVFFIAFNGNFCNSQPSSNFTVPMTSTLSRKESQDTSLTGLDKSNLSSCPLWLQRCPFCFVFLPLGCLFQCEEMEMTEYE